MTLLFAYGINRFSRDVPQLNVSSVSFEYWFQLGSFYSNKLDGGQNELKSRKWPFSGERLDIYQTN